MNIDWGQMGLRDSSLRSGEVGRLDEWGGLTLIGDELSIG